MNQHSLHGKTVIVTGGGSGIGLATVRKLIACGASVSVCDIDNAALQQAAQALESEPRILFEKVDVTDRDSFHAFLVKTKNHFGRVDGVASIAGTGGRRLGFESIWQTTPEEYQYIMDVNVRSTFNILAEALTPGVLQEPGSFVCVGSMFSQKGFKEGAVFAASKHAMLGMAKSAAKEVGGRGIRVNTVLPGAIDTPMHKRNVDAGFPNPVPDSPVPRLGKAEEVAEVIVFLLSAEASFVTGAEYLVDGGANA